MRTDLTPGFLAELDKTEVNPRLLVEFHFPGGTRYLSDQAIGTTDGLANDYEPIIRSWGSLRDNVRLEPIIAGTSLETRQLTLTVINSTEPRFSDAFLNENPENVLVYLYQWFATLPESDKALIDVFVCQDPITTSEASAIVQIQLVSPIMVNNNYVWGPNKTVDVRYPLVIGKATVVAEHDGNAPIGYLIYDIDATQTGELFVEGDVTFPASGDITIDSEILSYDSRTVTGFNITARGVRGTTARPHIRGALVCNPDDNFDYPVAAGPVSAIDNLVADGEAYGNPYQVFTGTNPAFIRFQGRPAWHEVEAGTPGPPITPPEEDTNQYGAAYEEYRYKALPHTSPNNINNAAGSNAVLRVDSTIGGNITDRELGNSSDCSVDDWPGAVIEFCNRMIGSGGTWARAYFTAGQNMTRTIPWAGVVFELGAIFGKDLSSNGTYVGCYISLPYIISRAGGITSTFEVVLDVNGTEEILYQQSVGHLNPGASRQDITVQDLYFDVSSYITSWSNLQAAKLYVRQTVTDSVPYDTQSGWNWYLYAESLSVYWDVVYLDSSSDPTYPITELVSHFNQDLSSLGDFRSATLHIEFDGDANSSDGVTSTQYVVFRTTDDPADNGTLWSRSVDSQYFAMATQTLYPSISTWTALQNARLGIRHVVNGPASPGDRRRITTNIARVLWEIRYQPGDISTPDEERVVYVTELLCDVTSQNGANTTPPETVQTLLDTVGGLAGYIDQANFDSNTAAYQAQNFYFNGVIDGATKFHDALKDVLRQGLLRIIYNAGTIRLASSFIEVQAAVRIDQENPDIQFEQHQLRRRAIREERMRFDDITNRVTIQYKPNAQQDEWDGEIEKTDDPSINEIGEQHSSFQFSLVRDDTVADTIATRMLERLATPKVYTTIQTYMSAFPLEKVDTVLALTEFNNYVAIVGRVLTINRVFGSSRDNRINHFEITLDSVPVNVLRLDLADTIRITENVVTGLTEPLTIDIAETVELSETIDHVATTEHRIEIAETIQISETVDVLKGAEISLFIQEVLEISDDYSTELVQSIALGLVDAVNLYETIQHHLSEIHTLDFTETIGIEDQHFRTETFQQNYGQGGYGEGGYGGTDGDWIVYFGPDFVVFNTDEVYHKKT